MGPKDSPHWNKNIIQFEDFTTIITTRSIIIAGIQRYLDMDENIEVQEAKVLEELNREPDWNGLSLRYNPS